MKRNQRGDQTHLRERANEKGASVMRARAPTRVCLFAVILAGMPSCLFAAEPLTGSPR